MKGDLAETENSLVDDEESSQSMRRDLENIYALLFRFVGNGFKLALCNVGQLATRLFVVLMPDPIVFAPWSVLLDRTASLVSPVNTHLTTLPSQGGQLRSGKSDVYQQLPLDVVLCSLLSHAPSQDHRQGEQEGRLRRRRRGTGCSRGSLSSEWEEGKKSRARSGSRCEPRKTVAPTAGWLSNP